MSGSGGAAPPPETGLPLSPPPPPPVESTSREEVLRSLYVWSAQTRRTVAVWQREESRFLWPLLGFIVLSLGAGFVGGALFAFLTTGASWNLVLVLVAVDYALPIGGAILLYLFFRSRNQRLDRQAEHATAPATELPGNLIEASLVELAETDRTLASVRRRIWWIVFLACWLSIAVGTFSGGLLQQAYLAVTGITTLPLLVSFEFTYGVGLGIAGVLIAWNALYWRRVERRLGELQKSTTARRGAVASFEQTLWERL